MGRARAFSVVVAAAIGAVTVGACAPAVEVTAGTAVPVPASTTTSTAAPTTAPPATSTTTTTPTPITTVDAGDEPAADEIGEPAIEFPVKLRVTAGDQVARIEPLAIASSDPATGYNGFHSATRLASGRWVAIGFDAEGDGRQAERSAIWLSDDGQRWRRVGLEISGMPGQQALNSVLADPASGLVYIVGADLGVADTFRASRADAYLFVSDDNGESWDRQLIAPNALPVDALLTDQGLRIAALDASQGEPLGVVFRPAGLRWQRSVLPAVDGGFDRASSVGQILRSGNSLFAIGARTTTDPDVDDSPPLDLFEPALYPPADVAIWKSDDGGVTWAAWADEQFRGIEGSQTAVQLVNTAAGLFLATSDSPVADPESRRTTITVWRADGAGWTDLDLDLGAGPSLFPAGVWMSHQPGPFGSFSGGLAIVSTVYTDPDLLVASVWLTLVDTETLQHDSIDVTTESFFQQAEDVVTVDDVVWIFGRLERGARTTDLQVMELDVLTGT